VGACVALLAFALAIAAGLAAANSAATVLLRALLAMIVCYPVGLAAGAVWGRALAAGRGPEAPQEQQESLTTEAPVEAGGPARRAAA
jgi:hypothetical protein